MLPASNESAYAVLFFRQGEIIGEMLYSEFEAVLDSFIPLNTYASQTMHGVFVSINSRLHATACVFFLIDFDDQGFADKTWNLPLLQLAESAARGPDLGSGAIKLACYTQCPQPWYQRSLWDPDMSPGGGDLAKLQRAIQANKMGLAFKAGSEPDTTAEIAIPTLTAVASQSVSAPAEDHSDNQLSDKLYRNFRKRLASVLKKQRFRLATVRNAHKQRLEELGREHQARIENFREQINERQSALEKQQQVVDQLKATIDAQSSKMSQLRADFEARFKQAEFTSAEQIQLLNRQFEAEVSARIESATTDLKETIQLREIENQYLAQHQNNLLSEIQSLREEKAALQDASGDKVIDRLSAAGISFIAYQIGLGHINISRDELAAYIEDPESFAASKCGVSMQTYRGWLEHFTSPRCQALSKDGTVCGRSIAKVNSPLDFYYGESDRCDEHRKNNVVNLRFGKS